MTTTIAYDEPGVAYDDACYLYDGYNICENPLPVPVDIQPRPGYWLGRSSQKRREQEEHQRKANFIAVTIRSKPLSVNGFEFDLGERELRFSGEDGEVDVVSLNRAYPVISEPLPVNPQARQALAPAASRAPPKQEPAFEVQMIPEVAVSLIEEADNSTKIQVQASVLVNPEPKIQASVLVNPEPEIQIYCEHPIITFQEMGGSNGRTNKDPENES